MKNLHLAWYNADTVYGPYRMWSAHITERSERETDAAATGLTYHPSRCVDRNLETGGDTDFEEPLVAPFNGLILAAGDYGGRIGGVIQLMGRDADGNIIVWGGWHTRNFVVVPGSIVQMGDDIGAIGNAGGVYAAHLHEQILIVGKAGIPYPTTYPSDNQYNWQQPDTFYLDHGVPEEVVNRVKYRDGA